MIFLTVALFQFDLVFAMHLTSFELVILNEFNPSFQAFKNLGLSIFNAIQCGSISLSNIVIYCYFGAYTTATFLKYSATLYNAEWYESSFDEQKSVKMMIAHMQEPLLFHGYRFIYLNLETLLKV